MECSKCGTDLGSMQVHTDYTCKQQQEINRKNISGDTAPCPWCGQRPASINYAPHADHKEGCPRRRV